MAKPSSPGPVKSVSEPPENGWDDDAPEDPATGLPNRALAPAIGDARGAPAPADLTPELEQQLLGVLRAALEETLAPLLEKQKELEARLEALRRAEQRATVAAPPSALVNTSYGPVSLPPPGAPRRSSIEIEAASLGPVEMPDFGSRRRIVGGLIIAFLIAVVLAAILSTILSYA